MELRNDVRKARVLDVVINYGALGLVRGRSGNIGLGGMSVDLGCIQLPVDAPVRVSFDLCPETPGRYCTIEARVVHNRDLAVGLMFLKLENNSLEALRSLLSDHGQEIAA